MSINKQETLLNSSSSDKSEFPICIENAGINIILLYTSIIKILINFPRRISFEIAAKSDILKLKRAVAEISKTLQRVEKKIDKIITCENSNSV